MQTPELTSMQIALAPQSGAALRAWTTGQILQATVVRQGADGTLTLRVGQQEVQAKTGLALATDQPLTLQVAQAGTRVVLRVLNASAQAAASTPPDTTRTTGTTPEQTVLAQAWRQVLPRDGNWQPLLNQMAQQLAAPNTPNAPATPLPPPVLNALRQLIAQFPTMAQVTTANGLRQALADSGLFLENHLAQAAQQGTPAPVQHDLKAALSQLVATLRAQLPAASTTQAAPAASTPSSSSATATPAPLAPLLQQADAALARVEQQQLTVLTQTSTTPAPLMVELPVRTEPQPQLVQLSIGEEQQHNKADAEKIWNVWLRFDFEALGHVEARVTLSGETVSVNLWAEQPATAGLFNNHLAELDRTLQQAGLSTALSCQSGRPRHGNSDEPPPTRLLDERA